MEDGTGFFLGFGIVALVLALVGLVLYIWSIVWVYNDANRRGKPGLIIAILVALFAWPFGLILWMLVRPNHPNRTY
ncbi:hypothetical protein [Rufibacter roseus]|uniref:Cardiolipin synthase N-terminal domain-containing protein n=1 Tax=Rufibacter roseus TaxID=1567108 RepID=A0ABW2DLV2_9BACT|nr:hypothetical protein [Rufibacter roseus]